MAEPEGLPLPPPPLLRSPLIKCRCPSPGHLGHLGLSLGHLTLTLTLRRPRLEAWSLRSGHLGPSTWPPSWRLPALPCPPVVSSQHCSRGSSRSHALVCSRRLANTSWLFPQLPLKVRVQEPTSTPPAPGKHPAGFSVTTGDRNFSQVQPISLVSWGLRCLGPTPLPLWDRRTQPGFLREGNRRGTPHPSPAPLSGPQESELQGRAGGHGGRCWSPNTGVVAGWGLGAPLPQAGGNAPRVRALSPHTTTTAGLTRPHAAPAWGSRSSTVTPLHSREKVTPESPCPRALGTRAPRCLPPGRCERPGPPAQVAALPPQLLRAPARPASELGRGGPPPPRLSLSLAAGP